MVWLSGVSLGRAAGLLATGWRRLFMPPVSFGP